MTEKTYLQNYFKNLTHGKETIPDEAILIDEHSINTATNMEELAKIIANNYGRKVVMITNDFQMNRAVQFACDNGVATSPLSAESVVVYQNPARAEAVRVLYDSMETKFAQLKEWFELILTGWDPKGKIPTLVKGITR